MKINLEYIATLIAVNLTRVNKIYSLYMVVTYNKFIVACLWTFPIDKDVLNHACEGSITESNMSAEILRRSFLEPMEL